MLKALLKFISKICCKIFDSIFIWNWNLINQRQIVDSQTEFQLDEIERYYLNETFQDVKCSATSIQSQTIDLSPGY
jgi:hypothetical protein